MVLLVGRGEDKPGYDLKLGRYGEIPFEFVVCGSPLIFKGLVNIYLTTATLVLNAQNGLVLVYITFFRETCIAKVTLDANVASGQILLL